jgi:phosphatidylglycerol:prolipoprotein diacylglycerol transferase
MSIPLDPAALFAAITFTPDPIAFTIGPLPVFWYGMGYAVGLAGAAWVMAREARRLGEDPDIIPNGLLVVALAALIGGRLYHVIDQWQLYANEPLKIVLPPYSGLGVYGGIVTGTLAAVWYTRRRGLSFWRWADIIAPGLFVMQAIARWGNFFNQELYGGPTDLPWGIAIDCAHRVSAYPCSAFPPDTTFFHPLFLYESVSAMLGLAFILWLGRRFRDRLLAGDLLLVFFVWYGTTRFVLETFRTDNWLFFGIPTAQIVSAAFVLGSIAILIRRHRRRPAEASGVPASPEAPDPALSASAVASDPRSDPA